MTSLRLEDVFLSEITTKIWCASLRAFGDVNIFPARLRASSKAGPPFKMGSFVTKAFNSSLVE